MRKRSYLHLVGNYLSSPISSTHPWPHHTFNRWFDILSWIKTLPEARQEASAHLLLQAIVRVGKKAGIDVFLLAMRLQLAEKINAPFSDLPYTSFESKAHKMTSVLRGGIGAVYGFIAGPLHPGIIAKRQKLSTAYQGDTSNTPPSFLQRCGTLLMSPFAGLVHGAACASHSTFAALHHDLAEAFTGNEETALMPPQQPLPTPVSTGTGNSLVNSNLPYDVLGVIAHFSSAVALTKLRGVCHDLKTISDSHRNWPKRLLIAGFPPSLVQQLTPQHPFPTLAGELFHLSYRIPHARRADITQLWEALILTGHQDALTAVQRQNLSTLQNAQRTTGVHYAAWRGSVAMLTLSVQSPPNNFYTVDAMGCHALHYAAWSGSVETIAFVISKIRPQDLKVVDTLGRSALHYAALSGCPEAIECLMTYISPQDHPTDNSGYTLAHCAALSGSLDAITYVHQLNEVDCGIASQDGSLVRHCVVRSGNLEAIHQLEHPTPASFNPDHQSFLHLIASSRSPIALKQYFEKWGRFLNINGRDANGQTALHVALKSDMPVEMFEALLEMGADHSMQDNQHNTPLQLASPLIQNKLRKLIHATVQRRRPRP